jgi:hypothetical protein
VAGVLLLLAALALARPVAAQGDQRPVVVVRPAPDETIVAATPRYTVVARGLGVPDSSITLELQVSRTAGFESAFIVYADTARGDSVDFVPPRPLPSGAQLWWRAIARIDGAVTATSPVTGPRRAAVWLTLVAPDAPNGVILDTRRPRFVWTSAPVTVPPGPWRYDLVVEVAGTGERIVASGLEDTSYVLPRDLEANTSYRWSVTAYLPSTGDAQRVASVGSFVITTPDRPLATLLYQNFPNPFPTAATRTTCVWFDLARPAPVQLQILTLRGDRVRTLYPLGAEELVMRPGRYGRADVGSNTGCDPRFSWDGRSDTGHEAAPGVYLLRLRVGQRWETRKIVFLGN